MHVGSFQATLENVVLPIGLNVDRIELDGTGLEIHHSPIRVTVERPGRLTVEVTQESLAAYLEKMAPAGLHDFKVKATNGQLHVHAVKKVMVDIPAKAICSLRIVGQEELHVDVESVEVMGAGAKNLIQAQLDKLNPVLNAKDLPIPARLLHAEIQEGKLILRGEVSPPAF